MVAIEEFAHTPVLQLLTGHFHETFGYRVHRPGGVGDWLLIQTIAGSGRFGHAAGNVVTAPDDLVLIRPDTLHDYGVAHPGATWELVWAHFQPRAHWLELLHWPEIAPGLMLITLTTPAVSSLLLDVHQHSNGDLRRREAFALNTLERLLLNCDQLHHRPADDRLDERVARAMNYMDRSFAEKISIDDIAANVRLSSSRLAHLFRTETNQTVQRYLEDRRMRHAIDLLTRTGFSVKQIASAVGYESPFYFSQRFKRRTGKSPLSFRASGRPEAVSQGPAGSR